MAKPRGINTKGSIAAHTGTELVDKLKRVGVKVGKDRLTIKPNALGIHLLGTVDSLVRFHGYKSVATKPSAQEHVYSVEARSLRKQEKRRKATLLRKQMARV
jgi:hypothetical protein